MNGGEGGGVCIGLLFKVTPFEYNYCLNNLVADCSKMFKDVLGLLHEYSAIQLICKEIAPQANLQVDCTCIKEMKHCATNVFNIFLSFFLFWTAIYFHLTPTERGWQ